MKSVTVKTRPETSAILDALRLCALSGGVKEFSYPKVIRAGLAQYKKLNG